LDTLRAVWVVKLLSVNGVRAMAKTGRSSMGSVGRWAYAGRLRSKVVRGALDASAPAVQDVGVAHLMWPTT